MSGSAAAAGAASFSQKRPVNIHKREGEGEYQCRFCPSRHYNTISLYMSHLAAQHSSSEGGSYTCHYGDNGICNACPAVGISHADYVAHVTRHHVLIRPPSTMSLDRLTFASHNNTWGVYSSCVNLPAVLNDPNKGKQKDFFTRSWGVDFVDSAILPSSPHICELPPNAFERYLRKVRKYYSRHNREGVVGSLAARRDTASVAGGSSGSSIGIGLDKDTSNSQSVSSGSSREATPSPGPLPSHSTARSSPHRFIPQKLDVPSIFLDQNFDLSVPSTFNQVFPFLQDTLGSSGRSNPFHLDQTEAKQVEKSGKLVQEKLSHYLDQVEVNIAQQVASKSHHFFQVMTYHDVLMSQLIDLIAVVKTLRERLAHVEQGVMLALKVPQLALRKQNLEAVIQALSTISTLHQTQPTIQVLLSRQEFAGALDLIATSQDIIRDDVKDIAALKHLPSQLSELVDVIGRMLMSDFQAVLNKELERDILPCKASEMDEDMCESELDECALGSLVMGLVRQQSYTFLEYFEESGINAVKTVIKDVVLSILDPTEDTTLTNLVAEFAMIATPDGWTDLLDLLVGSLIVCLRRLDVIYQVITVSLDNGVAHKLDIDLDCVAPSDAGLTNHTSAANGPTNDMAAAGGQDDKEKNSGQTDEQVILNKLKSTANEVMINVCDQVHERLGKLLTVRSRANAVKLIRPSELAHLHNLIKKFSKVTSSMCGKQSPGLQLSLQGQTLLYIQQFHETTRGGIVKVLENEKWRQHWLESIPKLHHTIRSVVNLVSSGGSGNTPQLDWMVVTGLDQPFVFVESVITLLTSLSDYYNLLDQLPLAAVEIGVKIADLLKLFNSRTCQLVLGAGAVSLAGLKTITIRNLAVTLRSLCLINSLIPILRSALEAKCPGLNDKQALTIGRNFDQAVKDYTEHLGELERKIILIVDAALQQQLGTWTRKPPVPSNSFKAIGKQLAKLLEAIQEVLPPSQVTKLFRTIHAQFLRRVGDRVREHRLKPDNSPAHGLVVSELIFYRENLKYMNVLTPDDLSDQTLQSVWN